MSRRSAFVLGLAVVAALAATDLAQAAVPETTIKKMQDSATEALEVTVTSVQEVKEASSVPGHPGCTRSVILPLARRSTSCDARRAAWGPEARSPSITRSSLSGPAISPE